MALLTAAAQPTQHELRFAASVAGVRRDAPRRQVHRHFSDEDVTELTESAPKEDSEDYRREFVSLVEVAQTRIPPKPAEERVGDLSR